jgi:hypothetical protein
MNAHVLLLGAGTVGRAAAGFAAGSPLVGRLTIADRDVSAAERAAGPADGRGRSARVDITDQASLERLIRQADVVLNCTGPYFRFGPPVLAAAVAAGRPYLDVCDDWEPTLSMLEQDPAARAAGVTAVIGQGASPGTANLLAMAAAAAVEDPQTLLTGWSLDDDPGDEAGAANEHWLQQSTGSIRVWRNGGLVDEPPLQELTVAFPGRPPRSALTVGHPEAVTLPRTVPGLQLCLNVMTLPGALAETLKRAARAVDVEGLSLLGASLRVLSEHVPGAGPDLPDYPGTWALAVGAGGEAAGAHMPDYGAMTDMGTVTAAPLIAGMELLLAGKARGPGVATPEEAFSVDDYFSALARVARVDGPMLEVIRP